MKKDHKLFMSLFAAILLVAAMMVFPPRSFACGGDGLTSENGDVTNCEDVPTDAKVLDKSEDSEEESDEYYFGADANVNSEADVSHSLFLAGNEVSSKDSVFGIGLLAGNFVTAAGSYDYGFFAGNSIEISGEVSEDLFVAGNAINIKEDASIGRDVFAAGNIVNISANLSGNVFAGGNRLVLNNVTIDGNFDAEFDEIVINGKSSISGTFKYNENANVVGLENLATGAKETYAEASGSPSPLSRFLDKVLTIIGLVILAAVLCAVFKKTVTRMTKDFLPKNIFKHVLIGLALLIFVPLLSIFAMITRIGLPLGATTLALWSLSLLFSGIVSGLIFGDILARKVFKQEKMSAFLKATLGIAIIELLSLVPVLGILTSFFAVTFGFGYLFETARSASK
ncbi:hypothetical protein IJI70_02965 [Candidatus Saccharibacteria bacterium]|nr:hypothetical protein [Candidatus Saccharibacteria bacterium]